MKKNLLLLLSFAILIAGGISSNVFSQNLLTNSGFEDADAAWNSWAQNGGAATFSIVTDAANAPEGSNYMEVVVTALGTNSYNIQTQTPTFQVVQGLEYEVSWWAKSDVAGSTMNLYFADPAGQQYGGKKTLTTDWVLYSKTWTAAETGETVIKINWESVDAYAIDSFVVLDPAPAPAASNLLTNGGFEQDKEGWSEWANGTGAATFTIETDNAPEGEKYYKADVDTLSDKNYHIQTLTPTFPVIKDSTYKVSWFAKSDTAGKIMNLWFTDPAGQQYGAKKETTTEWQEYTKDWIAAETGDCQIKINWQSVGNYYLDSFFVADPTYDPGLEQQTIDFPAIDDKFTTDAAFDITATASSGLPVTLTLVSGPATLDSTTVTLTGDPGTVTIKASQEGNDTINAATEVEQSFDVTIEDWVYEQTLELDVKFALGTMTIDGIANEPEWDVVDAEMADTYYNDPNNEPNYYTSDITDEDLSGWFKVLWSESGIYVYADISDDVIHTDSLDIHTNGGAHQYDNLEVYFHVPLADWTEDLKASESYEAGTFQMRSNIGIGDYWSGRSPYAAGTSGGWTSSALDGLYEYAFADKDGGLTFEGFYPFDNLFGGSTAPLPNRLGEVRSILFELAYGDSDGAGTGGLRAGGIVWNTIPDILNSYSDLAAHDRTQLGQINLTTEIAEPVNSNAVDEIDNSVKVYPTVFDDYIRIQSANKVVDVKLYNVMGAEMLHVHDLGGIENVNGLSVLNSGVYFLKMKSGNRSTVAKIIKE